MTPRSHAGIEHNSSRPASRRPSVPNAVVVVALAVLLLDYATKQWAWTSLRHRPELPLAGDRLRLAFAFNPGSVFGWGSEHGQANAIFGAIAAVSLILVVVASRYATRSPWGTMRSALGLAAGGIAGNLTDRLIRTHHRRIDWLREASFHDCLAHAVAIRDAYLTDHRYLDLPQRGVVDFIVIELAPGRAWPAFNVADASLCTALVVITWTIVRVRGLEGLT